MDRYTFSFKEKPVQLDQIFQLQKKKQKRKGWKSCNYVT